MSSEFFKKSHNSEDFNQNTGELVRWLWNSSRIKFWSEYWWNFWRISIRSLEILWKIWRISIRILLKDLKDFDQNSGGELVRWLWNSSRIAIRFFYTLIWDSLYLFVIYFEDVLKLRFGVWRKVRQTDRGGYRSQSSATSGLKTRIVMACVRYISFSAITLFNRNYFLFLLSKIVALHKYDY